MDRFEDAFLREAKSQIRALNDGLLAVENGDASVHELFRVAHSLKGTCRTQGLPEAGELAHALEDLLDALRSGAVEPAAAPIDEALAVVDCLEAVVRAHANGDELDRDVDATLESLRAALDERRTRSAPGDDAGGRPSDDVPGDEWDPADSELSDDVVAALEETTEFDDIDALLDDDGASDEDLDGWGLLDETEGSDQEKADGAQPADGTESSDGTQSPDRTDTADREGPEDGVETPDDPSAFFEETKSDLDRTDAIDSLQEDIDAVEFGEFDDDDNYTIDELLDLDPDESAPGADGATFEEGEADSGVGENDDDSTVRERDDESGFEEREDGAGAGDVVGADAAEATAGSATSSDSPRAESPSSEPTTGQQEPDPTVESPDSGAVDDADEGTAATLGEGTVDEDAAGEFVFGTSEADDSEPSEAPGDDELPTAADELVTADGESASGDEPGDAAESATAGDVPDPDSVPDSVPETELGVELSAELDAGSDDELSDDSQLDVPVDEEMAAFESRFGDLLGGGAGAETPREGPTFRAAVSTIEESRLDADEFPTAAASRESEGPGEFDRLQELTVDVDTADRLLNVAEELSLTHLRLDEAVGPDTDEAISEEVSNLLRVVTEYRRTVMDVRLVPLRTAIDHVPRTVRDVARSQDKEVELVVEDADVELDRSIIDELRDPLVHVARNAVDHGIESPEDRIAAGKSPEGTVEIRAERVGDRVVIEVEDDGRGIDPEAVRQRAVDTGVRTRKEARRLDDEAVYDLLFEPGFTTREEVTDVSGRGVGMDVVSRAVAELDGTVAVDSVPGEGTTVRLTVPVSIVFTEVLFVEADGETFGIPMSVVEQITATPPVETEDGREVVRRSDLDAIGGFPDDADTDTAKTDGGDPDPEEAESDDRDAYPLVRLASALDLRDGADADGPEDGRATAEGQVVWVREADESLAIHCDRVVTSREVVVRPYGDLLRDVPGVGGATTLGDGEAVNVLDVSTI